MVLNRIKHLQIRATSRSINNAAIIKFGSYTWEICTSEAVFLGLHPRKCALGFAAGLELLCSYLLGVLCVTMLYIICNVSTVSDIGAPETRYCQCVLIADIGWHAPSGNIPYCIVLFTEHCFCYSSSSSPSLCLYYSVLILYVYYCYFEPYHTPSLNICVGWKTVCSRRQRPGT